MACTTQTGLTAAAKAAQQSALERLKLALGSGLAKVVIGRNGGLAIAGWLATEREGISDACAYRALANSPEMRRAVMRAESMAGRKVSLAAMLGGVHSHDGGQTWDKH
jgi:hypothetical protein